MKALKTKYPGIYRIGKNYFIDYYGPDGKRHREVAGRKLSDAVGRKEEIKDQIRRGRYFAERKRYPTTFDELIQKYRDLYKDQRSYKTSKVFVLKVLEEHFKGRLLSQITPYDIESFRKLRKATPLLPRKRKKNNEDLLSLSLNGKTRSDASVNRELACLSHLFSKAVEWEMVEESPFKRTKGLFLKENNQRTRFLSEEEIKNLLAVDYEGLPPYLKPIIATAIYTGLRKAEILNLKWKDVDLDRAMIYVRENKQNRLQVKMINDDLVSLFMKQPVRGEYLFHDEEGKPLKDLKRSFHTALKRAGIENVRFHDLRHTSCSYLTMRGASPKAVQDHAGHASIKMTMRYSHLSPEFQRGTVQLLNGLCEGVLKEEVLEDSEGHSKKIVRTCQKSEEVRQSKSPNLLIPMVELMGIEPTTS
jgi:integrase